MQNLTLNYPNIVDGLGQVHSIADCREYLTFGPWLYLVPQYRPESVLMLGYGGGTAAGLMRLFYGDMPITAVDMLDCSAFDTYNVELIKADALEWVMRTDRRFDAVVVDLFREGSYYPEPFVYSPTFAQRLSDIGNYLILHSVQGDDLSSYAHLRKIRTLSLGRTDPYAPEFHYFLVHDIARLPVR